MKTIFISATAVDSGQSLTAWLIAKKLIDSGKKVGVFRPMGVRDPATGDDPILSLLLDSFGDQVVGERTGPVMVEPGTGVDPDLAELYAGKISKAFEAKKDQCDVCIAIGSRDVFFDAEQSSLPDTRFIEMLDARVLLIDRFRSKAMTFYSTLALASFLRDRLAGIVINRVPSDAFDQFQEETLPILRQKGVPISGVLPDDPVLSSPTVQDVAEVIDAEILVGRESLDRLVTGKTISAHDLPGAMKLMKRVVNKLLLTGGSPESITEGRGDEICGVVLTGGKPPADPVLKAAEKEGMTALLTKYDTFTVIDKLDNATFHVKARDLAKLARFEKLLTAQTTLDDLLAACGV
jgi:uncharacterized protein